MAKKTSKTDFAKLSQEELSKSIKESRAKLAEVQISLSGSKPHEKRSLRRNIARAMTALTTK